MALYKRRSFSVVTPRNQQPVLHSDRTERRRWSKLWLVLLVAVTFAFGRFSDKIAASLFRTPSNTQGGFVFPNPEPFAIPPLWESSSEPFKLAVISDRPVYIPGEPVHVQCTVLDVSSRLPIPLSQLGKIRVRVAASSGAEVATWSTDRKSEQIQLLSNSTSANSSTIALTWKTTVLHSGGKYKLFVGVTQPQNPYTFFESEREFELREYRDDRTIIVDVSLEDGKAGYSGGETVGAVATIRRSDGGLLHPTTFTSAKAQLLLGGSVASTATLQMGNATVDSNNAVKLHFDTTLPKAIFSDDALLHVFVSIGGGPVETGSVSLPVVMKSVNVRVFSESGPAVAGVPSWLFVEVRTSRGDPVETFTANIVEDGTDKIVGQVHGEYDGRGKVLFNPENAKTYSINFTSPPGLVQRKAVAKPSAQISYSQIGEFVHVRSWDSHPNASVVLSLVDVLEGNVRGYRTAVFNASEPIAVAVRVPRDAQNMPVFVTMNRRNHELANVTVFPRAASEDSSYATAVALFTSDTLDAMIPVVDPHGILHVAAFGAAHRYAPEMRQLVAERLIFRRPRNELAISVRTDSDLTPVLTPRGNVSLIVRVVDKSTGQPVPSAHVGLFVTDASTLDLVQRRRAPPRLPAITLLEDEVDEVVYSRTILGSDLGLEMMLGSQAWRWGAFHIPRHSLPYPGEQLNDKLSRLVGGHQTQNFGTIPEMAQADEFLAGAAPMRAIPMVRLLAKEGVANFAVHSAPAMAQNFDHHQEAEKTVTSISSAASRPTATTHIRSDFTKTVHWSPELITNEHGESRVQFTLSDMVTKFRVVADAYHGAAVGGFEGLELQSTMPFSVAAKVPRVLTEGDVMLVPVDLSSNVDVPMQLQSCQVTASEPTLIAISAVPQQQSGDTTTNLIAPQAQSRCFVRCDVASNHSAVAWTTNQVKLDVEASAALVGVSSTTSQRAVFSDRVVRDIRVVRRGFPVSVGQQSGSLQAGTSSTLELVLPQTATAHSVNVTAKLFPSPLSSLGEALVSLIQEPHGCFEQTSATVYPLIMAMQYFKAHPGSITPSDQKKAEDTLTRGFNRLASFEVSGGGFEWFGRSPAHEALTAYGVLEFTDMQQVFPVPQELIDRTVAWLMQRRDGDSFALNPQSLDSFGGAPLHTTAAYLLWALSEAGHTQGLERQLQRLLQLGEESANDAYVVALAASVAFNIGQAERGKTLLDHLATLQQEAGNVGGAKTSITRSTGQSLEVETTALAVLAFSHQADTRTLQMQRAVEWINTRRTNGHFGSTQATVLALKAILQFEKVLASATQKQSIQGEVVVSLDKTVVQTLQFVVGQRDAVDLGSQLTPQLQQLLADGQTHTLQVALILTTGQDASTLPTALSKLALPFSVEVSAYAATPASSDAQKQPVTMSTRLLATEPLREGDAVSLEVSVAANPDWVAAQNSIWFSRLPMTVAVVGIPAGLEVIHDKLHELVRAGDIDFFEVVDNEVVLYWRSFDASHHGENSKRVLIHTSALIPGVFTSVASRSYLYYSAEFKHWVGGTRVEILPQDFVVQA